MGVVFGVSAGPWTSLDRSTRCAGEYAAAQHVVDSSIVRFAYTSKVNIPTKTTLMMVGPFKLFGGRVVLQ